MNDPADQTLNSPDHAVWQIIALESGMPISDVKATSIVRHRLLAASALCVEILDDASPTAVIEVFKQISREANLSSRQPLNWPQPNDT